MLVSEYLDHMWGGKEWDGWRQMNGTPKISKMKFIILHGEGMRLYSKYLEGYAR